jgi:hypothetical protein
MSSQMCMACGLWLVNLCHRCVWLVACQFVSQMCVACGLSICATNVCGLWLVNLCHKCVGIVNFLNFILLYIPIFIKTANQSAVIDLPGEVRTPQFEKQCLLVIL